MYGDSIPAPDLRHVSQGTDRGNWWRFTLTGLFSGILAIGGYMIAGARSEERQKLRIDALETVVNLTLTPAVTSLKTDTAVQARENQVLRDGIARLEAALREVALDVKALRQPNPK